MCLHQVWQMGYKKITQHILIKESLGSTFFIGIFLSSFHFEMECHDIPRSWYFETYIIAEGESNRALTSLFNSIRPLLKLSLCMKRFYRGSFGHVLYWYGWLISILPQKMNARCTSELVSKYIYSRSFDIVTSIPLICWAYGYREWNVSEFDQIVKAEFKQEVIQTHAISEIK